VRASAEGCASRLPGRQLQLTGTAFRGACTPGHALCWVCLECTSRSAAELLPAAQRRVAAFLAGVPGSLVQSVHLAASPGLQAGTAGTSAEASACVGATGTVRRPTQMRQDLQCQQLAAYSPLGVVLASNPGPAKADTTSRARCSSPAGAPDWLIASLCRLAAHPFFCQPRLLGSAKEGGVQSLVDQVTVATPARRARARACGLWRWRPALQDF